MSEVICIVGGGGRCQQKWSLSSASPLHLHGVGEPYGIYTNAVDIHWDSFYLATLLIIMTKRLT